ncbi:hypothetical protein EI020_24540, partial [Escherichia coli]|uniref:hypothetical protein n=1 Tax=Escherichia coli TaxID=562 RepID=UPI00128EF4FF
MTVENPTQGEVFSVRSYKQYSGTPWANTYEIRCTNDGATRNDLISAALAIVAAERNIHWTGVNFYRVSQFILSVTAITVQFRDFAVDQRCNHSRFRRFNARIPCECR